MKLKKVTGKKGRPTIVEVAVINGIFTKPEGKWVIAEMSFEEKFELPLLGVGTRFE